MYLIINILLAYDEYETIMNAMNDFHKYTCVRFVPYNGQSVYISITSEYSGCHSFIGYIRQIYNVNLQTPGCTSMKGTVMHELMHVLGFVHEQSRHDRDHFVYIQWDNIINEAKHDFDKYSNTIVNGYGVSYDYKSIMHYSRDAFSINGKETIIPLGNAQVQLGQRDGLSEMDIEKINRMYECNKAPRKYQRNRKYSDQKRFEYFSYVSRY